MHKNEVEPLKDLVAEALAKCEDAELLYMIWRLLVKSVG